MICCCSKKGCPAFKKTSLLSLFLSFIFLFFFYYKLQLLCSLFSYSSSHRFISQYNFFVVFPVLYVTSATRARLLYAFCSMHTDPDSVCEYTGYSALNQRKSTLLSLRSLSLISLSFFYFFMLCYRHQLAILAHFCITFIMLYMSLLFLLLLLMKDVVSELFKSHNDLKFHQKSLLTMIMP